jgi:hypothetical protein
VAGQCRGRGWPTAKEQNYFSCVSRELRWWPDSAEDEVDLQLRSNITSLVSLGSCSGGRTVQRTRLTCI